MQPALAFVKDWNDGLSLSNAVVDKSHPGIDCRHGHLRLVLTVTGWTSRRFRSAATSRGEIHDRDAKTPGIRACQGAYQRRTDCTGRARCMERAPADCRAGK